MIQSKRINIIIAIAVVFALLVSMLLIFLGKSDLLNTSASEPLYASELFGTDLISIEIKADEKDWQEMLDNAINEEFIAVDVTVNGTEFKNVGIRPKGNSSLTQVVNSDSDRYSFRLQFDKYIKGQTCFGLQSFVVNNILGDNTYMKEYVSYELMQEAGVDAPYFGFTNIKVNGNAWGLYLAVELYNDSYEQRVFGDTCGMLYNVKSRDMGGGGMNGERPEGTRQSDKKDTDKAKNEESFTNQPPPSDASQKTASIQESETKESTGDRTKQGNNSTGSPFQNGLDSKTGMNTPGGGMGGPGGNSNNGGSLEYSDDSSSSYSSIFDNVVGKGSEANYQSVIKAIKALNEGNELEKYFEVDQILRYLAAHTIVVNLDSYSSSMAQNYYIYENDGKVTILPWDYNLAWGGFQSRDASSVINFPIDTPLSGVEMASRPLIQKLFENEEYLTRYHSYLQELIDHYFSNGKFEEKVNTLSALIDESVQNDTTAFCSYEEYKTSLEAFITLGNLRAESIQGQLDKTIPSTTEEQAANPDKLISADGLNLSVLGSMMQSKGDDKGGGENGARGDKTVPTNSNMPDSALMQQAMQILMSSNGEVTDSLKTQLSELGLTKEQIENLVSMQASFSNRERNSKQPSDTMQNGKNQNAMPSDRHGNQEINWDYLLEITILIGILTVGIFIAAKAKRNY